MAKLSLTPEQWHQLRLIRTQNIGPATYRSLCNTHSSAEAACAWLKEHKAGKITLATKEALKHEMQILDGLGGRLLWDTDSIFPEALKHIPQTPPVLSILGNPECLRHPMVSIVGARNASHAGLHFAQKLALELSERGYCIVSGMARGIDSVAHQGSLKANTDIGTIAILAGGVDIPYPPENRMLYEEIQQNGLIISEMPIATESKPRLFPRRNRIIAGLSAITIVIEASHNSGSGITANFAADFGREVGAVPGSPLDSRNQFTNRLIREGAHVICSTQDVIDIIDRLESRQIKEPSLTSFPIPQMVAQDTLPLIKEAIWDYIGVSPARLDDVIAHLPYPEAAVLSCLSEMEIDAEIIRDWDNSIQRNLDNNENE